MHTGTVGNLTAYKRHDMDEIIVRLKGGPKRERVKNGEEFVNTRKNNHEFGGRSRATRYMRTNLVELLPLADYNFTGHLNAIMKPVQLMDTESEWGKRNLIFSKQPGVFDGFSFNRKYTLESVIRSPVRYTLSRDTLKAEVTIPALVPDINFHVPGSFPMYSLTAVLSVLPDLFYTEHRYTPSHEDYGGLPNPTVFSEWYPVLSGSPAVTLSMDTMMPAPDQSFVAVLAIGIRYGTMGANGTIQQIKRAGSAKIIAAV
jgi:hypothetical protein